MLGPGQEEGPFKVCVPKNNDLVIMSPLIWMIDGYVSMNVRGMTKIKPSICLE